MKIATFFDATCRTSEEGTLVLKQLGNCGRRNRRIGVAVGHAEDKSGEDRLAVGMRQGTPSFWQGHGNVPELDSKITFGMASDIE